MSASRVSLVALLVVSCARASVWSTPETEDASVAGQVDASVDAATAAGACGGPSTHLLQVGAAAAVRLAVADSGEVHVVVLRLRGRTPVYLRRDASGTWTQEEIGAPAVQISSLLVDGSGALHVATSSAEGNTLRVGRRSPSGTWSWEAIAVVPYRIGEPALALGADGRRYVIYAEYDGVGGVPVWFAQSDGAAWRAERVPAPSAYGLFSLAIDGEHRPHVVFGTLGTGGREGLGYGYKASDGWRFTSLTEPVAYIEAGALALDDAGRPNIAYYSVGDRGAVHARLTDTGWRSSLVAVASMATSIAFGPAGPRILTRSLYHRRWIVAAPAEHDTYDITDVYPGNIVQQGALGVDRAGAIHVVTVDDEGSLVYSRPCDPDAVAAAWRY